jgi:hypothetical protein
LELFPELENTLNSCDYLTYQLFVALRHMVWHAHDAGDDPKLRAIYGFAAWCREQQSDALWNAAGVSFYKHLFDERNDRADWRRSLHGSRRRRIRHMPGWPGFPSGIAPDDPDHLTVARHFGLAIEIVSGGNTYLRL